MMMKKIISIVLTIFIGFMVIGCGEKKDEKSKQDNENKKQFKIKIAENVVNNYLNYLVNEDYDNMITLFSEELKEKSKKVTPNNLKTKAYKIIDIQEVGERGEFEVNIVKIDMEKPFTSLEKCMIEVVYENNQYKINSINIKPEKEVFSENNTLRLREKTIPETKLLIDNSSIPKYAYNKDNKSAVLKIETPEEGFQALSIDYSGYKVCMTRSNDKYTYIALVGLDEAIAVQGGADESGADEKKKKEDRVREKPIAKEVMSMDILENVKVEYALFSLEESAVVLQVNKEGTGRWIRLYDARSGDLTENEIDKMFSVDEVELVFAGFEKETMFFDVISKGKLDLSKDKILGRWKIDLKDFAIEKM